MEDLWMFLALIGSVILGAIFFAHLKSRKKEVWIDNDILIIHDKEINKELLQYANTTSSIEMEMIYRYSYIIIYTDNDYNNMMFIYHIKKQNERCKIYSVCNEYEMKSLYLKENVNVFEKKHLDVLVKDLYEKNHK